MNDNVITDGEIQKVQEQFRIENDNYLSTINIIKIFGHELCWDAIRGQLKEDAYFWPGRRMKTSKANKVLKKGEITPDIVIQFGANLGAVAEIKQSLPRDLTYWKKTFEQMLKYDDSLTGWYAQGSKTIPHDLVLLLPTRLRVKVIDYLDKSEPTLLDNFERKPVIICFHREPRAQEFFSLCRVAGELTDKYKDEELRVTKNVPANKVLPRYSFAFYDQKPPLPYIMDKIWFQISNYINADEMINGKNNPSIVFTDDQIIKDMRIANSFENDDALVPELPKGTWIREGISALKELGYLKPSAISGGYFIERSKFKRVRTPLDTFIDKISKRNVKKKKSKRQLELFNIRSLGDSTETKS